MAIESENGDAFYVDEHRSWESSDAEVITKQCDFLLQNLARPLDYDCVCLQVHAFLSSGFPLGMPPSVVAP